MYDTIYRGLPAELRLMIWKIVLEDVVPRELILGRKLMGRMYGRARTPSENPIDVAEDPMMNKLVLLRLNHETRNEAMSVLPKHTILDLSNLRRQSDLSKFLDNVPPWIYHITDGLIVDRSYGIYIRYPTIKAASMEDFDRLYSLIDGIIHLDRLVFVIDASECQGSKSTLGNSKVERIRWALHELWGPKDTEAIVSRIRQGNVREVALILTHGEYARGKWWLYDPFFQKLSEDARIHVKRASGSLHDRSMQPGYGFLLKFRRGWFTNITLTKPKGKSKSKFDGIGNLRVIEQASGLQAKTSVSDNPLTSVELLPHYVQGV